MKQRDVMARTGNQRYEDFRRDFIRLFNDIARYHSRHEVFRDFIAMGTLAVQNAFLRSPALETEYLEIARRYERDDVIRMSQLLGCLSGALECRSGDFLGSIFMELEIGSAHMGQFFTPYSLSQLMAKLVASDAADKLSHEPFIMLDEPASGAGSMVIAVAKTLAEQGYNPQEKLVVRCTDVDATAAGMCYLQLSYLGIPAEVVTGNSLTLSVRRVMRTPLWYIGNWEQRIKDREWVAALKGLIRA